MTTGSMTSGAVPGSAPPRPHRPPSRRPRVPLRDDRWPDWLATLCLVMAAASFVIALVPPWRRYFARADDVVSALLLPVVPNIVYVAVLLGLGAGLRRRLRPAWWAFLLLLVLVPGVGRIGYVVSGANRWPNAAGLLVTVVLVAALLSSQRFMCLHAGLGDVVGRIARRRGDALFRAGDDQRARASPRPPACRGPKAPLSAQHAGKSLVSSTTLFSPSQPNRAARPAGYRHWP